MSINYIILVVEIDTITHMYYIYINKCIYYNNNKGVCMSILNYLKENLDDNLKILSVDSVDATFNTNLISESGLSRVLDHLENNSFAIITANRGEYDAKENEKRNKELRDILNANKMGSHALIGHWQECQDSSIEDYNKCPKDQLVDVVENSFLFPKPKSMSDEDFIEFIASLNKKFEQDGAVVKLSDGSINIVDKSGDYFSIGNKTTLGKISQAYSQYVKKRDIPFVFEGVQVPATLIGKRLFSENNILYPKLDNFIGCKKLSDII